VSGADNWTMLIQALLFGTNLDEENTFEIEAHWPRKQATCSRINKGVEVQTCTPPPVDCSPFQYTISLNLLWPGASSEKACEKEFTDYYDIVPDYKNPKEWEEPGRECHPGQYSSDKLVVQMKK